VIEYPLNPDFKFKNNIPAVQHATGKYTYDWENTTRWHWHQMVAQLDADSMEFVVQGDGEETGRSRGLVACSVVQNNRYDHKRSRTGTTYCIWDYILYRADGSCVALHPEHSKTKFTCTVGLPIPDLDIPESGHYLPMRNNLLISPHSVRRRYTFYSFNHRQHVKTLKFDASKKADAKAPQSRPRQPPPAPEALFEDVLVLWGPPPPGLPMPQNPPAPPRREATPASWMETANRNGAQENEGQWELRIGGEQTQAEWENFNRNDDQHWDEIEEEINRSRVKVINRSRVFTHTVPKERVEDAVAVVEEPSQVINRSRVKVINRRLCLPTQLEDIREDDERPDSPHDFVMVEFEVPQSRDEPDPDAEADQTPKP